MGTTSSQNLLDTSCVLHPLLTKNKIRIMTDGDRRFLARLVASHKAVISEECARKKLNKSEYFRRASRVDKKAQEIERAYMRPRKF